LAHPGYCSSMVGQLLLVVAVRLVVNAGASESPSWKQLQQRAVLSEKASAIAASKVEYYKKIHDLKSAMKWMRREKLQYAKSQQAIEAAALAHPVPNKETATAQVTAAVSGSVSTEMGKLAETASSPQEGQADSMIAKMEARNAAGARAQAHAVMQYYKQLPALQNNVEQLRSQYTSEKAEREVAVHAANKDLKSYYTMKNQHSSEESMSLAAAKASQAAGAVAQYDQALDHVAKQEATESKQLVHDEGQLSKTSVGGLRHAATSMKSQALNWELAGKQHQAYERAMLKVNDRNYHQVQNLKNSVEGKESKVEQENTQKSFSTFLQTQAAPALRKANQLQSPDQSDLSVPGADDTLGNNLEPTQTTANEIPSQPGVPPSAGIPVGMFGGAVIVGSILAMAIGKKGAPSQTGYARVSSGMMADDTELS